MKVTLARIRKTWRAPYPKLPGFPARMKQSFLYLVEGRSTPPSLWKISTLSSVILPFMMKFLAPCVDTFTPNETSLTTRRLRRDFYRKWRRFGSVNTERETDYIISANIISLVQAPHLQESSYWVSMWKEVNYSPTDLSRYYIFEEGP